MSPFGHGRVLGLVVRHAATLPRQDPSRRLTEEERRGGVYLGEAGGGRGSEGRGRTRSRRAIVSVRFGSQHSSTLSTRSY